MNQATRVHSTAYLALVAAAVLLNLLHLSLDSTSSLICLVLVNVLLGVPHGASDTLIVKRASGSAGPLRWIGFVAAYLALIALVVGVWWLAPQRFLVAFLVMSAFHFAWDLEPGAHPLSRALYGGAIIIVPVLRFEPTIFEYFGYLAADPGPLVGLMHRLAGPWLLATLAAAAFEGRRSREAATDLLCVAILPAVLSPLVAFTVYYCFMHSIRHMLRTMAFTGGTFRSLLPVLLVPTLVTFVGLAVAFSLSSSVAVEARSVRVLFVGLAALTLPHMIVQQIRLKLAGQRVTELALDLGAAAGS